MFGELMSFGELTERHSFRLDTLSLPIATIPLAAASLSPSPLSIEMPPDDADALAPDEMVMLLLSLSLPVPVDSTADPPLVLSAPDEASMLPPLLAAARNVMKTIIFITFKSTLP